MKYQLGDVATVKRCNYPESHFSHNRDGHESHAKILRNIRTRGCAETCFN